MKITFKPKQDFYQDFIKFQLEQQKTLLCEVTDKEVVIIDNSFIDNVNKWKYFTTKYNLTMIVEGIEEYISDFDELEYQQEKKLFSIKYQKYMEILEYLLSGNKELIIPYCEYFESLDIEFNEEIKRKLDSQLDFLSKLNDWNLCEFDRKLNIETVVNNIKEICGKL
jgi:hypothetical protein